MHTTQVILLVEDSDEDYEALVRALRGIDDMVSLYRCRRADEVIEYLHGRGHFALPAPAPRPVLILLDLNLPGIDGRDLLAMLKGEAYSQAIPVVVVTVAQPTRYRVVLCARGGRLSGQRHGLPAIQSGATAARGALAASEPLPANAEGR